MTDDTLNYLILNFLLPGLPVLLMALAWLARNRLPKTALAVFWSMVAVLWMAATPALAQRWMAWVESRHPPLALNAIPQADMIVVLSGGRRPDAPEYGGSDGMLFDTVERTRYGALLAKRTGLPVVVSGGQLRPNATPLATLMKAMLQNELGVANVQAEDKSRTTLQNAQFVARMIGPNKTVLLVTSAMHMPRSALDFEQQGVRVIAAPTAFAGGRPSSLRAWVPSTVAFRLTSDALRETLGLARSTLRGL
jgi:uncharacterized SAM-binding protein YcdF (DUF218 family)